jgi:hypothetical protein
MILKSIITKKITTKNAIVMELQANTISEHHRSNWNTEEPGKTKAPIYSFVPRKIFLKFSQRKEKISRRKSLLITSSSKIRMIL